MKKDGQVLSGRASRIKSGRYTAWLLGGLVVIATVVAVWMILHNSPSSISESAAVNSRATTQSVENPAAIDTTATTGGPRISFPETEFNFGTIAQGTKVSHTFVVRNIGDAPLRLIKAKGS